ncbi:GNAT family N-acetyltransferase [Candidatus Acetothermia bacterium]|jgi:RimJ/RimL family protein N-acetyltransferase|nr:GNAT family N-acetyltransferase [Candidatus Acetothermia bacterium]MCI2427802.1 GNAT family N-acetyltransferase [Candidatus Acetothermia bacterium]MCI2428291.1 GNAT family N-acetyltransferase [Candidatus Acetothermia bacterium]
MPNHTVEIHGKRVTIRYTAIHDLPDLMTLWNDGRVMKWVGFPEGLGYDPDKLKNWFSKLQADPNRHHFVVHVKGTGFCGELYYEADKAHKRAGLDIKLIPEAQGQGIATDALKTLIRHVFESEPELEAVWTEPSEENIAARRLYERCGLKPKPRPVDMEQGSSYWELQRDDWINVQEK